MFDSSAQASDAPMARIDPTALRSVTWWQWVLTVALLVGHVMGCLICFALTLLLTAASVIVAAGTFKGVHPMPVQIRAGFLAFLLAAMLPGMGWLTFVLIAGVSTRVLTGYCLLERELKLLPWNAEGKLTLNRALRVLSAPPGRGGLLRMSWRDDAVDAGCAAAVNR